MLYVSRYDSEKCLYGVTDTDDGVTQYYPEPELLEVVSTLGVVIEGVSADGVRVIEVAKSQRERMRRWVTKAKMLGYYDQFTFSGVEDERLVGYMGPAEKVVIPPVRIIGKSCFAWTAECPTTIIMPDTVEVIEDNAFEGMWVAEDSVLDTRNIKTIGARAFYGVVGSNLRMSFPNVEKIDSYAFCGSRKKFRDGGLLQLELGDKLEVIPVGMCLSCYELEEVKFGRNVKIISDHAFSCCTSLDSIKIPKSVTTIGDYAYHECASMCGRAIKLVIPESIRSIGEHAFSSIRRLEHVIIRGRVKTLPSSVFFYCEHLASITLPDCLEAIGKDCFLCCRELGHIRLPKSLVEIGESAFCECSSLNIVHFPDRIKSVGMGAFHKCINLRAVRVNFDIMDNVFSECLRLGGIEFGVKCTKIGAHAFQDCMALKSVTIPSHIKFVAFWAFAIDPVSRNYQDQYKVYVSRGSNAVSDVFAQGRTVCYM